MIDKFKIFNKVKIDTDNYEEIETNNHEKMKIKMQEKLKYSQRSKNKTKKKNIIISTAASISIVVIGIGVMNPSLADNLIQNINEFRTMLDKIKDSVVDDATVEYDPSNYPEREEEKRENEKNKLIATPVGVSSKSDGLQITIDKAMYDKKKLYLDMTLKTDELFEKSQYIKAIDDSPYGDGVKNMYIGDLEIYINDVKHDGYAYGPGVVEFIDGNTINLTYLIELNVNNDVEDANFELKFNIPKYDNTDIKGNLKGEWDFDFNIKTIDDDSRKIDVNEKDGDYTLKSINVTKTYVEAKMELPFEVELGKPHDNFIVVLDDKGNELQMSKSTDGPGKNSTQIYELVNVGEIPKSIEVIVIESYMDLFDRSKYLSSFKVDVEDVE